jgi:tetratricopeptide (TPR) repeat protein
MLALGQAQLATGQNADALVTLSRLVVWAPDSSEAHRAHARARRRANDIAGARTSLERALALSPDSVPALAGLAEVDIIQGRNDAALAVATRIQQDYPEDAAGYLLQGDVLMARQQPAAAVAAYQSALERDRTWTGISKLQAAYRRMGEPNRGDALVFGWLQANPRDLAARLALAEELEQRGALEQASREYELALQYQPDSVLILTRLARLKGGAGDPQALDLAQRAHELLPEDPQVQGTYGWLLAQYQDSERGLELLQTAIEQAPKDAEIRYWLAATLALNRDRVRARQELQTLLDMNQDVIDPAELQRALDDLD